MDRRRRPSVARPYSGYAGPMIDSLVGPLTQSGIEARYNERMAAFNRVAKEMVLNASTPRIRGRSATGSHARVLGESSMAKAQPTKSRSPSRVSSAFYQRQLDWQVQKDRSTLVERKRREQEKREVDTTAFTPRHVRASHYVGGGRTSNEIGRIIENLNRVKAILEIKH